ncbi:MAG: hypothetical protein QOF70_6384 [Acetobacteraceae bacterium]|nr:hypothetical protein [Acetobacteraceae bacterium]
MQRKTLIASEFNAKNRAHFAQAYEFCSVVAECEDADLTAPDVDEYLERRFGAILPAHDSHNVQRDFNRLTNGLRKGLRLKNAATMQTVDITENYDLFFFVGWSPQSLVELSRLKNWRGRCKIAVAYLFELWSTTLESDRAYLKMLDQFDHVFLLHSKSIPQLPTYTSTPCSALPTGIDCLVATPYPSPPERAVDVYSIGNRSDPVHQALLELTRKRDFFYIYDSLASTDSRVKSWADHRALLANTIKRSRYFIGFNPMSLTSPKAGKISGEHVLPGRLFEGAAGGAIILGTAPQCPEFNDCFDWDGAVVEVSPDGSDIVAVIEELDAQYDWTERLRETNATRCLMKHDWVYRWEHILAKIGLDPLPRLQQRKSRLAEIAAAAIGKVPTELPATGVLRNSKCSLP